jgi:hypothetical protein
LFPHLASASENDDINDEIEDGMPYKIKDVGTGSKIKHHQILHKMHAPQKPQYPTYTAPTYGQEYAPYPTYDSNPAYGHMLGLYMWDIEVFEEHAFYVKFDGALF